jgi:hypothetical protein
VGGRSAGLAEVRCQPSLNRWSLGTVVDYFLQSGAAPQWQEPVQLLHRLSTVADLRNKGLSGHGFQGISLSQLEQKYGASLDVLLESLASIYRSMFQRDVGQSPYAAVNELVDTFL